MHLWKISKANATFAAFLLAATMVVVMVTAAEATSASMETNKLKEKPINQNSESEIYELKTNITLFQKRILRLEVSWKDYLANDTSYNIFVNALNRTMCPDPPCGIYGIKREKINGKLLLPENPEIIVDVPECGYMFGCRYHLTVETSNMKMKKISKSQEFEIPYCVLDVCSCQHAQNLPKVQLSADVPKNDTINCNWSIKLSGDGNRAGNYATKQEKYILAAIKMHKIYLKIREQTNPSLSWGGNLIPIAEKVYSLNDIKYTTTNNTLNGTFKIKTNRGMTPKAVLNLQTFVEDDLRCPGPENLIKVKVPAFNEPLTELVEDVVQIHIAWIIATIIFVCFVILCLLLCIWRRQKQRQHDIELKQNENCLSPFAAAMEMEDNLNYVDKYIEEAQAKGLADVFEVPHYAVQLEVEIGEGAFGRVYKGVAINLRRMRGATVVAVKQLKKNPTADEVSEFLSEIEMLKGVGTHNNIVCFLGCCTIRPPYLMIMEYVGRGDLLTYLRTVRQYAAKPRNANYVSSKPISGTKLEPVKYIELKISAQSAQSFDSDAESERQPKPSFAETTYTVIDDEQEFDYILDHKELHNFALQIANGMRFLEEQEITHRDLAARNVLIDERKTLKISDFGLSRHGIYTNTKTRKLPLRWLSIEAIRDNVYSNKSDVWAYGVVLWEIGTLGASPYPAISNHELIPFLVSGKRLDKPEICTSQVYDIMLQCWHEDPLERPNFEELFKMLSPKTSYVDISSLSDDYVFPPIKVNDDITSTGS